MATAVAAAKHIFLSESRFNQLARTGIWEPAKKGRDYNLDRLREIAFTQLRDELRGRGDHATGLTEERTRLARAKANGAEREDLAAQGKLIDIDAVATVWNSERSVVKESLLTMGGELQGPLDMIPGAEAAAIVDSKAREILTELSDPDSIVRRAARVAAGLEDLQASTPKKKKRESDDA
jgi:hypothetical protein